MYATGIVRRMDDLGRVVIPKEIRRTMGIKEGDPLEIYTDHETGSVVFRICKPANIKDELQSFIDTHKETINDNVVQLLEIAKNLIEEG